MVEVEEPLAMQASVTPFVTTPSFMERNISPQDSYFPLQRPASRFLRVPSAADAYQRRRTSVVRRAISSDPAKPSAITLTNQTLPEHEDLFDDLMEAKADWIDSHDIPFLDDDDFARSPFSSEGDIAMLDLSNSGFDTVPLSLFAEGDMFMGIKSLDLSQNPLDFSEHAYMTESLLLPQLTSLYIRQCGMSHIEPLVRFLKAPNLEELDISQHNLSGFVPELQRFFPRIQTLLANNGQFSWLEEVAVKGLRLIDLTNNNIGEEDRDRYTSMCAGLGARLLL